MHARLLRAIGVARPWMWTLVRAARSRYGDAPAARSTNSRDGLRRARHFARRVTIGARSFTTRHRRRRWRSRRGAFRRLPRRESSRSGSGVDIEELIVLADRRGISRSSPDQRARHYRYAWIPKPSGGHRLVEAPKWRLRTAQRRILDGILNHIPPHDAAHGFREGRSVVTFAQQHVGREVVMRVDLQAFFASVFAARVIGMLRTAGYPEEVSRTLAALCTHRTPSDVLAASPERDPIDLARLRTPHLPQGAPTSGALANLAAYRLDVRVAGLAASSARRYSRYADDLVLSGDRELARAAPTIVARLAAIAIDEGFSLNFRKTRVMTASARQRITGIVVNEKLVRSAQRARAASRDPAQLQAPRSGDQNREGHRRLPLAPARTRRVDQLARSEEGRAPAGDVRRNHVGVAGGSRCRRPPRSPGLIGDPIVDIASSVAMTGRFRRHQDAARKPPDAACAWHRRCNKTASCKRFPTSISQRLQVVSARRTATRPSSGRRSRRFDRAPGRRGAGRTAPDRGRRRAGCPRGRRDRGQHRWLHRRLHERAPLHDEALVDHQALRRNSAGVISVQRRNAR